MCDSPKAVSSSRDPIEVMTLLHVLIVCNKVLDPASSGGALEHVIRSRIRDGETSTYLLLMDNLS